MIKICVTKSIQIIFKMACKMIGAGDTRMERNISAVCIARCSCGALKYHETILCDKNPKNEGYAKTLERRNLVTRKLISDHSFDDIENIFTVRRKKLNDGKIMHGYNRSSDKCESLGLLLQSDTVFFELTTIPSVEWGYPPHDTSYMDSLIICRKFANGLQGKLAIDKLFLTKKIIKTSIVVTDDRCYLRDVFNIALSINPSLGSIDFTTYCGDVVAKFDDYTFGKGIKQISIPELLQTFDHDHRFFITIGDGVEGFEHVIKFNQMVTESEFQCFQLRPVEMNYEAIKHFMDEHTRASKNLSNPLKPFVKRFTENRLYKINIWDHDDLLNALKNYGKASPNSFYKYTVMYSMILLMNTLVDRYVLKQCGPDFVTDNTIYKYARSKYVNGEKMCIHLETTKPPALKDYFVQDSCHYFSNY